jgi:hypothetical protein
MEIRILRRGEEDALSRTAPAVFDNAVKRRLSARFLADARRHLAVAVDDGLVVGFASRSRRP